MIRCVHHQTELNNSIQPEATQRAKLTPTPNTRHPTPDTLWSSVTFQVIDMMRRLALTCGTMVFDSLAGFVLFSLSVAMLSLLGHTQLLPFDTELMDNMNRYWMPLITLP